MAEKKRLGRGLSALIGERAAAGSAHGERRGGDRADGCRARPAPDAAGESRLRDLPVADIAASSRQPRRSFDEAELQELAESIRSLGVVQPVVVRRAPAGARRRGN